MADKKTLELQIKLIAQQAAAQIKTFAQDVQTAAKNAKSFSLDTKSMTATVGAMQKEAQRAANSLKLFGGSASELRAQQQRMKSAILDLIDNGLKPESKEVQDLVSQYNKLDAAIDKAESSHKKMEGGMSSTQRALAGMNNVALGLAGSIAGAGLASIKFAGELEQTQLALEVLLGDAEQATKIKDQWTALAAETPFSSEDIDSAGKKLLAFNIESEKVTDTLRRIGDISAATGSSISEIADIYGKAKVQGRLFAEDINQFQGRGIPVLQSLAKVLGVAETEVRNLVTEGKVGFPELEQAFTLMTNEGGQFAGMMEKLSTSTMGQFSTLMDNAKLALADFGELMLPTANKVMQGISGILEGIREMDTGTRKSITTFAGFVAAIAAAIPVVNGLTGALTFLAANPVVLGIGAVALAVGAIAAASVKAANAYQDYNEELVKTKSAADNLLSTYAEGNNAKKLDEQATRDLIAIYPELRGEVSAYATTVEEAAEAVKKLHEQKVIDAATPQIESLLRMTESSQDIEGQLPAAQAKVRETQAQMEASRYFDTSADATTAYENAVRELEALESTLNNYENKIPEKVAMINANLATIGKTLDDNYQIVDLPIELKPEVEVAPIVEPIREIKEEVQKEVEKIEEIKIPPLFDDDWFVKNMTQLEKLERDYKNSVEALNNDAKASFGESWEVNEAYIKEAGELEKWYAKERIRITEEIAKKERDALINRHKLRMDQLAEEGRYLAAQGLQQAEAGNLGGIAKVAGGTLMESVAGTQLGGSAMSAASGAASGGIFGAVLGPIAQFITALLEAILALENVQKILNWASTIVEKMFDVIGDMLNDGLEPIVDLLETLGTTIGKILAPLINMSNAINAITLAPALKIIEAVLSQIGSAFEWFNNDIIVPFGNTLINIANSFIDLLNKIPGVDIDKIENLRLVGQAAEDMAKEFEKHAERVRLMYDRQKSAVEDQLQSQLDSLQSQFELGLISQAEYEKKAQQYMSSADDEIIAINERMEAHLARIEEFTGAALTEEQWKQLYNDASEAEKQSYAKDWGETVPVLGHIAGGIVDVGKSIWDGVGGLFGWWDVGSPNIPYDHIAMVHKGETIVPRTFADGIRSGELALVGGNSSANSSGGSPIYVTVNVGGSVLSERDIVDAVHRGISDGIASRRLSPLPAGA